MRERRSNWLFRTTLLINHGSENNQTHRIYNLRGRERAEESGRKGDPTDSPRSGGIMHGAPLRRAAIESTSLKERVT
jgi:hypothetical protein